MKNKISIVFFGTPDFSVPCLDLLFNHPNIELSLVVSMPDRPAGRGQELKSPEVIEFAKMHKIPFIQTENINKDDQALLKLESVKADVFIVLAFAQFLNQKVLSMPKFGAFNIHTSLLPKYRGAAPIQYALLNGDKSTGVSIQRMVQKMDAGNLVKSKTVSIAPMETGGQLYTRLKFESALLLNDFIYDIKNNSINETPQNDVDISFAPTLKRDDGHINFSQCNRVDIFNKVRALHPWPGTFCFLNNKRLKIFSIEFSNLSLAPGSVKNHMGQLIIGCIDGSIRILELQLEGKKRSTDIELLNGLKDSLVITTPTGN